MVRNQVSILTSSNGEYVVQLAKCLRQLKFQTSIYLIHNPKMMDVVWIAQKKLKHHGILSLMHSLYQRTKFLFTWDKRAITKVKNLAGFFAKSDPNSLTILYNTGLIPADLLRKNKREPILVAHPAYLPHGRGFDGTRQAILQGVPPGVSLLEIDEGIDTGAVWNQSVVDLGGCKNLKALRQRQASLSLKLTVDSCLQWRKNCVKKIKLPALPIIKLKQEDRDMADKLLLELIKKSGVDNLQNH